MLILSDCRVVCSSILVLSIAITACSTGPGGSCDGKTSALCATGGSESHAGGATGLAVGGTTSTGGVTSTSSTVLKIEGNKIRDLSKGNTSGSLPGHPEADSGADAGTEEDGIAVVLHGVNRSGTEYQCVNGYGIFDGPDTEDSVKAIASWKVNAVRVPLNESCWLGINGVKPAYAGSNYKIAIQNYVTLLHKYDIYPILELHWVAPGTEMAKSQLPMPDADHAADFGRT